MYLLYENESTKHIVLGLIENVDQLHHFQNLRRDEVSKCFYIPSLISNLVQTRLMYKLDDNRSDSYAIYHYRST